MNADDHLAELYNEKMTGVVQNKNGLIHYGHRPSLCRGCTLPVNGKVLLATLRLPGHREYVKDTNYRDDDAPESKLLPLIVRKYNDLA
ncbi:hypothetical protein ACDI13_12635 [Alcaligenes faecalis]|uniref:hypothetical protein n=1 Tax=Alcaligenes faecalis TaxID=511 RepID=UPI0035564F73